MIINIYFMRCSARLGAFLAIPRRGNRLNGLCCLFFRSPLISPMKNGQIKEGVCRGRLKPIP